MPRQAVALKKYRCGTSPVSKTSDNEHTAASLGHSEELSVQNSVGEPIPELAQEPEEGAKVPSSVAGQDAGDVFPDGVPESMRSSKFMGEHRERERDRAEQRQLGEEELAVQGGGKSWQIAGTDQQPAIHQTRYHDRADQNRTRETEAVQCAMAQSEMGDVDATRRTRDEQRQTEQGADPGAGCP